MRSSPSTLKNIHAPRCTRGLMPWKLVTGHFWERSLIWVFKEGWCSWIGRWSAGHQKGGISRVSQHGVSKLVHRTPANARQNVEALCFSFTFQTIVMLHVHIFPFYVDVSYWRSLCTSKDVNVCAVDNVDYIDVICSR